MDDSDRELLRAWYQEWKEDRLKRKFSDRIANILAYVAIGAMVFFLYIGILTFLSNLGL